MLVNCLSKTWVAQHQLDDLVLQRPPPKWDAFFTHILSLVPVHTDPQKYQIFWDHIHMCPEEMVPGRYARRYKETYHHMFPQADLNTKFLRNHFLQTLPKALLKSVQDLMSTDIQRRLHADPELASSIHLSDPHTWQDLAALLDTAISIANSVRLPIQSQ